MAKTYTLQSTSINPGWRSTWSQADWNDYSSAANLSGDLKKNWVGKVGWTTDRRATNILFDSSTLATLRTKTVTSIKLTLTVVSGTIPNANNYPIGYKLNSGTTAVGSWTRSNSASTAASTSVAAGYIKSSPSIEANNTSITLDMGTTVPVYGYTTGAYSESLSDHVILGTSATLTVVTNETDYSYTLKYDANGGNGAPSNQTGSNTRTSPSYTFTVSSTIPSRTGYSFLGWSQSSTATSASYVGGNSITVTSAGTTTLYAVWRINTYTVSYNKGSYGSGTNTSDTKTYGQSLTLKGAIFTRTGYTQTGWATSDGGAKAYNTSGSYTNNAAITLYPYWTAVTYTVTYAPGTYGSGSNYTDTKTHDVALTLRGATYTIFNYSQDGWSINSNGSTKDYNLSGSYTNNAATTLYPHWKADTYTVIYNANGGSGAPAAQTKTYGVSLTLSATIPSRTNYIFLGWATSATGTATYRTGTNHDQNTSYTANAAVTLYAIWQAAKSTLSSITSEVTVKSNVAGSGTAGWNIVNTAYTYTLVITYSNAPAVTVNVAENTASTSFSIPTTWLSYMQNVSSVTATATLTTYASGTSVGSTSLTFTVKVDDSVKPTISSFTHSPYSQNSVVNGWGVYVKGYSQVDLSVSATAGTGASIISIAFSGTGVSQSGTGTTARSSVVTSTGYITYSVTVTDSRNRTATSTLGSTARPYFYDYAPPVINSMTAFRSDSSGTQDSISGTYIRTSASFSFSSCGNKNSLSVKKIEYKLHAASSWASGVSSATSGTGYTIGGGNISITNSYDVRCTITDALSNTATYVVLVPPIVGFAVGLNNDRARFGGPVEKAGLQVDWNAEFNGVLDVTQRRCLATLSSQGWYRVMNVNTNSADASKFSVATIVDINIGTAYWANNNGTHKISLHGVLNSVSFVGEESKSNYMLVDKVRYTYDSSGNGHIDIHYIGTSGNPVWCSFTVHAPYNNQQFFVAVTPTSVADSPSGEAVMTTYTFKGNYNVSENNIITQISEADYPATTSPSQFPRASFMVTNATTSYPYAYGSVLTMQSTGNRGFQVNFGYGGDRIAVRMINNGAWTTWKKITTTNL